MWERILERLGLRHRQDERDETHGRRDIRGNDDFQRDRERWDYSDQATEHSDIERGERNRW